MRTLLIAAATALATLGSGTAMADKLGDHPAIIAQRIAASQGYDYAAKFYPHPAWMYLSAEAPRPMMEHPAVVVARREQQQREETARRLTQTAAAATVAQR